MTDAEIIYMPTPKTLLPEQRQHWQEQASYWGVREDDAQVALEYAQRHRQDALRMLGMLAVERGIPDGVA